MPVTIPERPIARTHALAYQASMAAFLRKTSAPGFAEYAVQRSHEHHASSAAGAGSAGLPGLTVCGGTGNDWLHQEERDMTDPLPTWVIDVAVLAGLGLGIWLGDLLGSWYRSRQ